MKMLYALTGAVLLLALMSGCAVAPGYGGSYASVYGEYPSTYYGGYYYPAQPYGYYHWDHDHYWDHGHWERHPYHYHYANHDRDDWRH